MEPMLAMVAGVVIFGLLVGGAIGAAVDYVIQR